MKSPRTAPYGLLVALLAGVLALAAPTGAAKAAPLYYETVVVEDAPDADFSQEWLDIVGVYIGEKFIFDAEKKERKGEHLAVRFEVKNLASLATPATIRFDLTGGAGINIFATITNSCGQNGCSLDPAGGTGDVRIFGNSVTVLVPHAGLSLTPGSVLTGLAASSSLDAGGNLILMDAAPQDNMNAPAQSLPTTGLLSYVIQGVYPFITVVPVTPTSQYSIGGAEVKYEFQLFSDPAIKDDNIRVYWEAPSGWTITPSQGKSGQDVEGQLTGGSDGVPRDFFFTLSSNDITEVGQAVTVVMEVLTDSGGRALVDTITTISGAKIEDPTLNITLDTPGPFKAESLNELRFTLANASGPLEAVQVSVDVFKGNTRESTVVALPVGNGTGSYKAMVNFAAEGTYTVDAYVSSLKPSPHQSFVVTAEKGGLAPGPAPAALILGLAAACFVARRRRAE